MGLRQRVLSAIAHPNIAYLLLSLGMLGLTVELWSPGAVLPGVVGALSLLLAFFSLSLLPVNYAGLLLIVLGMVLLILEIKVTSYGVLTIGGAASLIFGSMILVDSSAPELQLNLRLILPVVAGIVAVAALLVRLAVSARRLRPTTGEEGMIGAGRRGTHAGRAGSAGPHHHARRNLAGCFRRSDPRGRPRAHRRHRWTDAVGPQGVKVSA